MNEGKRVQLLSSVPLNHPRINGLLNIESDKPKEKTRKVHRFTLQLFEADNNKFPEFSYQTLLKSVVSVLFKSLGSYLIPFIRIYS